MEYRVRVYAGEKIQDTSLTGRDKLSVGSGAEDDCRIEDADGHVLASHLLLYKRNGKWFADSKDMGVLKSECEIKDGDIFILNQEKKIAVYILGRDMESAQSLDMKEKERAVIGRGVQCDLRLQGNNISRRHAIITRENGTYLLTDNGSLNGTFLNGEKIGQPEYIQDGDLIAIGNFNIRFRQGILTVLDEMDEAEAVEHQTVYPHWFQRAPRLRRELPGDLIEIQNPPQEATAPEGGLMQSIASPVVMVIIMVVMVGLSVMNPVMLIFTVPMSILTVILSVSSQKKQKKKYEQAVALRNSKYGAYLDGVEKEIGALKQKQLLAMQLDHPTPSECAGLLEARDTRLWSRQVSDGDFMCLRLGVGEGESSFTVRGVQKGFTLEEDHLLNRAREIETKAGTISDVPVLCDLRREGLVGVIGERAASVRLVCNLLLQAATHHTYDDLKVVLVYAGKEARQWEWVKWLPHCFDEGRERRYISSTAKGTDELLKELEEVFKARELAGRGGPVALPYYLFVFTQLELAEKQPILKYLLKEEGNPGAGAIFLYDEMHRLPKECNVVIEVKHGQGLLMEKRDMNRKRKFRMDSFDEKNLEKFARQMAPLRIYGSGGESALPACVTFLEGYGVHTPDELHADWLWKSGATYESMAVPIGVKADGEAFCFDIHEKQYGPHGLVAGMTGSGKSEMVQSWILSMALKFSPGDVSFVLIDFKGTGLILPFTDLPHLAGTISDLDKKIGRNLIALENELSRRKELLDRYGVNNINHYLRLQHAGKAQEPLSYLFVVIDEFAEFKVQFPDFMTVVDRIFAIGRTLGVFAILLTQKPAGVVDDKMNANTRFRWCLKVASSSDSREMLHHTDAARITVPGRAYVQVGEDEVYELVQSYYSGAPYRPDLENQSVAGQRVAIVEESGRRTYYENEEKMQAFADDRTEISEVVSYLRGVAQETGVGRAKQIWLPRLSGYICLEDIEPWNYQDGNWQNQKDTLCPIVGMVDDPGAQSQYPLVFDFTKDGHIAVFGAPGTGKTTLLQSAVMSVIGMYSPERVNLYLMDFGGWSLGMFKNFPHVGGVANDNEDVKIEKLVQLLERKLNERKETFSRAGVGSLQAYRQATGEILPDIVLVVDNFAPVLQLYPDLDAFFIRLTREGGSYGMYLLVSVNNPMALGFRINQNIRMAVALNMADRSDYQGIVGKTDGLEPENLEGRGLVKGNPPLEFQAALPVRGGSEGERTARIRGLSEEMRNHWKGMSAAPIPLMPERISYGEAAGGGITLGLSLQYVEPVCLSQARAHYLPVVGLSGSGKSNMMQVLAKQSLEQEGMQVAYLDLQQSATELDGHERCLYMTDADAFDAYMQELVPLLQERKNRHDADESAAFEPVSIFVDDYRQAFDALSEQTVKRLEAVIRLGRGLDVYLYIAEETDAFSRLCGQGEAVTMLMARENNAILLGGSLTAYPSFHSDLSGLQKNQALGQWEGYLIEKGNTTRFRAMSKE